jgi:SHS2 domain-containing protein
MSPGFEILDHTADMGFRASAATPPALFELCARALVSIVMDAAAALPSARRSILATGDDLEELLVAWLNEVLWLMDGERLAPAVVRVETLSDHRVTGWLEGEPRDDRRHPPRLVVKAATFHQLSIQREDAHWIAEVFLDV